MIFHVSQQLWDKVVETAEAGGHPLDLVYNRKVMQAQLDNIQRLIDNPLPAPSAPTARLSTPVSPRSGSAAIIGATVAIVVVTAAAGAQAYSKRRAARFAAKPATEPSTPPGAPELADGAAPMTENP